MRMMEFRQWLHEEQDPWHPDLELPYHPDNPPHLRRSPHEVRGYHYSIHPFDKFRERKHFFFTNPKAFKDSAIGSEESIRDRAEFHAGYPDHSNNYTYPYSIPAWLNTEKFKKVDLKGSYWNAAHDDIPRAVLRKKYDRPGFVNIYHHINRAVKQGYHGIVLKNVRDGNPSLAPQHQVVAWHPGTIRSSVSDHQWY